MTFIEKILSKLFHHIDIEEGGKLYLRRWFIYPRYPEFKKMEPRVYLHKFHNGDNLRDLHNHPWKFTSIILKGGYWEHSLNPAWQRWKALEDKSVNGGAVRGWRRTEPPKTVRKWYGPGSILRRGAKWTHAVELNTVVILDEGYTGELPVLPVPCWSLVRTGVKEQSWGFFTDKGFCNHAHYKNGICWCYEGEK